MSGAEDNFLARWSRRKQAVKALEPAEHRPENGSQCIPLDAEPETRPGSAEEHPVVPSGGPRSHPGSAPEGETEGPEPLPRIEDLTAESDMSVFLQAGVPQALKMAALRRAWSLDPAIRDYVGPAEYAHDFNNPATIPGFGSGPGWDASTAAEYAQKIVNSSGVERPENTLRTADGHSAQLARQSVRLDAEGGSAPVQDRGDPAQLAEAPASAAPGEIGEQAAERPEEAAAGPSPRHGGAMPR